MKRTHDLIVKWKEYRMLDGSEKELIQQISDGSIIKRFDKTPHPTRDVDVVCPHFLELKWAYGCPFDCAWCYLKGTLRLLPTKTKPVIKDFRKIRRHVLSFFRRGGEAEMLNSGEICDSLMSENMEAPFSEFIMRLFNNQEKHKVLFLTKSNRVENLIKLDNHSKSVVSFSLNAEPVARRWEKAPSIKSRIDAARKVSEAGFETRVRIDPIVPIAKWKEHYFDLLDRLFHTFRPERVTLGTLRGLHTTVREAGDKSWTKYLSEDSSWGKKTAFDQRSILYSSIIDHLSDEYGYDCVALCKETVEMWKFLKMDYTLIRCNCIL